LVAKSKEEELLSCGTLFIGTEVFKNETFGKYFYEIDHTTRKASVQTFSRQNIENMALLEKFLTL